MAENIMDALREHQLSKVKRSIASSESHEKKVSNTAARTAAVLTGQVFGNGEHMDEYRLRDLYFRELERYERKSHMEYAGQPFTPRGLSLWKRVAKAWRASGVDYETFVKAQFTYFHDTFRKAPTSQQLTTDAAVVRAASVAPKAVVTNNLAADINIADLFKRCEKQMNDVMRAQNMTREEVYTRLVVTGFVAFPEKYLNADPVWRKIKNG